VRIVSPFVEARRALHFRDFKYPCRPLGSYETLVLLEVVATGRAAATELTAGGAGESRRQELRQRVERGARAKNSLAMAYLWNADRWARHWLVRARATGCDVDDLTQEAFLGLLRAIDTFDPHGRRGFDHYAEVLMYGRIAHTVRRSLARDARPGAERDG